MGFELGQIVFVALALILPISALMGRQLSWNRTLVLALSWLAIFAVVTAVIALIQP